MSFGLEAVAFHLLFLGSVAGIVFFGVSHGIERVSKVMLPGVVLILLGLAVWTATQPGTAAGYAFYLSFDAEYLAANFLSVIGPAAGQALFTLSLGAGVMLTYASYLDDNASLPRDTLVIAVSNTFIGVLAGLVVIPLLFSQGVDPGQGGPGALFVALATAFATLPGGELVATAFFATVLMAAVTSGISLLETPVATLVDSFGVPRRRATVLVSVLLAATGSGLALTSGVPVRLRHARRLNVDRRTVRVHRHRRLATARGSADGVPRRNESFGWLARPWLLTVSWVLPVVVLFLLTNTLASLAGMSLGLGGRALIAVVGTVALAVAVTSGNWSDRLSSS